MANGKRRAGGGLAASILLAASIVAAPAMAKKPPPPPPPPPTDPDPWAGCTPYGSYIYDLDCCGYPDLVVPCESPTAEPVARPEDVSTQASGG
ncbi:MAG TPA: hypothetical protein VFQ67_02740 [Allosphingosinicella sp.]|nr:hypothetical protein [Allosphingosinicella sp.]